MSGFEILLAFGSLVTIAGWALISAYVLAIARRRAAAHATVSAAVSALTQSENRGLPSRERIERVRPILATATRELIMYAAVADQTPTDVGDVLVAWLVESWGVEALERDASSHRTTRDKWRRTTALQVLNRLATAKLINHVVHKLK